MSDMFWEFRKGCAADAYLPELHCGDGRRNVSIDYDPSRDEFSLSSNILIPTQRYRALDPILRIVEARSDLLPAIPVEDLVAFEAEVKKLKITSLH